MTKAIYIFTICNLVFSAIVAGFVAWQQDPAWLTYAAIVLNNFVFAGLWHMFYREES